MSKRTIKHKVNKLIALLVTLMFSVPILAQTSLVGNPLNKIVLQDEGQEKKKDKKRKDEFKVFGGVSFNNLKLDADLYKTTTGAGWLAGASYKRGKFLYWELGGRYNNQLFNLDNANLPPDSTSKYLDRLFAVRNIDVPVTFGINFLSFISRIVGLRVFISAVPSFVIGVGENDLNISKDKVNSFIFYGQGGVGVDVTFLYLEGGINYGFNDLLKDYNPSNPVQGFINLGFRF